MRSAVALLLLALVAGCASPSERGSFGPYAKAPHRTALRSPSPHLYVASAGADPVTGGSVEEYRVGSTRPFRTIFTGIDAPSSLALDRAGNLFVANYYASTVTVYAPGATTPSRTITKGIDRPGTLQFSHAGNLFVANLPSKFGDEPGSIAVFKPNASTPARTITNGIDGPKAIAFDSADRLYVANLYSPKSIGSSVTVYAQGGTVPISTITNGIAFPWGLAFDSVGRLYVANYGSDYGVIYPYSGDVTVYSAGKRRLLRTIRYGIGNPKTLAIDSHDVLYVTSYYTHNWITEYEPRTKTPFRTIAESAEVLLLDADDNLYAGNYDSVSYYPAGTVISSYAIPHGANALALGP